MAEEKAPVEVYQFHILLLQISPAIWRRLLVRSDTTLSQLHIIIQTAMGWEDEHLYRFHLQGRDYGSQRTANFWCENMFSPVRLSELSLRPKERFLYEYNFRLPGNIKFG